SIDVFLGRRPVRYGNPHRVHAVPAGAAQPADALLLHEPHGLACRGIGVARRGLDADQDLIQYDVVENADPRFFAQPIGKAARQSPNAPSTCSQAPWRFAMSAIGSRGSNAPVFTLPDCAQTIVGALEPAITVASASGRIRP